MPAKTKDAIGRLNAYGLAQELGRIGFSAKKLDGAKKLTFVCETSPLDFRVKVDTAMLTTPEKAYAQLQFSYRASTGELQPAPSALGQELDSEGVICDRTVTPTNGVHGDRFLQGYQVGITPRQSADTELQKAICRVVAYVRNYVSNRAQQK